MHAFRLRFFAPPGFSLDPLEQTLQLPGAPEAAFLRQLQAETNGLPTDPVVYVIDADGFPSKEEAQIFGQILKRSLAICSARLRLGFALGHDRATSSLGRDFRAQLRRDHNVDIRPTIHGLDVYDSSVPVRHFEIRARGSVSRAITTLPSELLRDFPAPDLPQKLTLALDLYNGCAHESDVEVRFLSLVSVVEAIAVRRPRRPCAQSFIDECINRLQSSATLDESEQVSIRSALGNLKSESISSACMNVVAMAGADVDLFKRVYKARSELLHDGISHTFPDLPRQADLLDTLVQKVLLDQVARAAITPVAGA